MSLWLRKSHSEPPVEMNHSDNQKTPHDKSLGVVWVMTVLPTRKNVSLTDALFSVNSTLLLSASNPITQT